MIEVDVKYIGDDIHFAVMDENVMSDDSIGSCVVKLSSFIGTEGNMDDWWEIQYEGKSAGHIHMKSTWTATGEELKEAPKPDEIKEVPPLKMTDGVVAQKQVTFGTPYYQQPAIVYTQPTPADQMAIATQQFYA